jgi:uncharacterized membrane protein
VGFGPLDTRRPDVRCHRLALGAIAWGYLAGVAFLSQLPLPYWPNATSSIAGTLLAFTLPTTAVTICLLLDGLWRREKSATVGSNGHAVLAAIVLRIVLFVVAVHTLLLIALAGMFPRAVNGGRVVLLLLGVATVLVGNLLPRMRRNHVIGIRTQCTMSNPHAWTRTHRAAGYAMVSVGLILSVVALSAPGPLMPAIVLPAAAVGTAAVVLIHRQHVAGRIE